MLDNTIDVKHVAAMYATNEATNELIESIVVGMKVRDVELDSIFTVVELHLTGFLADRFIKRKFIKYKDIIDGVYELVNV